MCEATYLSSEQSEAESRGHLTARQAATIAKEAHAKQLILTHFSQRYPSTEDFVREAQAIHHNVLAVQDGDAIVISK